MCLGNLHDDRVFEQCALTHGTTKGKPALHLHAVFLRQLAFLDALRIRMTFHLYDNWLYLSGIHTPLKPLLSSRHLKVAETKSAHLALLHSQLQVMPCRLDVSHWLMRIYEVNIVEVKSAKHTVDSSRVGIFRRPYLARHPNILALATTFCNKFIYGIANATFVHIGMSRVDMSISCTQSRKYSFLANLI